MNTLGAVMVGAGEDVYLDELSRLSETLGLSVMGSIYQRHRDGAGYLGKGKRSELGRMARDLGAGIAVVDDELTASQARVLENDASLSVVDRTELIIRIFESHARDSSSCLEVELADLEYRLPRIKGQNPAFSRLGGGSGGGRITRGPGEQQLEYDRRAIRNRIKVINQKLAREEKSRKNRNSRLKDSGEFTVALVGYTNAGKTTILNSLSGVRRSTADRLFETLETTTRHVSRADAARNGRTSKQTKQDFVVTDTVGFIRKLPTQLVHSFSSTLEASQDHDLRVLCADSSSPHLEEEIDTVTQTLESFSDTGEGFEEKDILCLNKVDLLDDDSRNALRTKYPNSVMISAANDTEDLYLAIRSALSEKGKRMRISLPYEKYGELDLLYDKAEIHSHEDTEDGALVEATIPSRFVSRYREHELLKNQ